MTEQSAQTASLKAVSGNWNQKFGNCFCVFALYSHVPAPCSLKQPENVPNLCKTHRAIAKVDWEVCCKPLPSDDELACMEWLMSNYATLATKQK